MKLVEISTIFSVSYGNKLDLNKMTRAKNGVAFVNRTGLNNGIVGYVKEIPSVQPYPSGVLTIALGGSVLSTFLQIKPFYTGQNVAVASPQIPLSEAELLYYATAIKANRFRYSTCGREANRTFRSLLIPDPSAIPPWVKDVDTHQYDGTDAPFIKQHSPKLQTSKWQSFILSALFDIKKGKRLTKADMKIGSVPFIGAIDGNNGLTAFVGQEALHEANTLTVNYNGNGVAESFYQPVPFRCSDDVNVLYPKFPMTPSIALFIATVIRQEKYRFSYGRKWGLERMKVSTIKLPTKQDGKPDWEFMETYIKSLPYSAQI